jgi:hypothetical protein
MCDSGNAIAVMGNHEYNAICFHTPHTENGGFFRDHSLKEIEQHIDTLRQIKHYQNEWTYFLNWFKTLPLFFEDDNFRMVHACWNNDHINWLKKNYNGMSSAFLTEASNKNTQAYKVVEETLKGIESKLPNGLNFTDKDGAIREECRIKWWSPNEKRKTFGQIMMECPEELKEKDIPSDSVFHSYNEKTPVFFGHYWLKGLPNIENDSAICLDYSVAKGGKLVAYRFDKNNGTLNSGLIY